MRYLQLLLLVCVLCSCTEQPKREVRAVIVSIAPHANPKWDNDEVVVTARSNDGAMGSKAVLRARLACRVGDTIPASAQGLALKFGKGACER